MIAGRTVSARDEEEVEDPISLKDEHGREDRMRHGIGRERQQGKETAGHEGICDAAARNEHEPLA